MKTHDLAKNLQMLSRILKSAPNMDLDDLNFNYLLKTNFMKKKELNNIDENDMPSALYNLVALNGINKSQWLKFIADYNLNIQVRDRDANRDIVGKVLNYYANNPSERDRLVSKNIKRSSTGSDELANALNLLLK
ncbi:hypothetical protein ASE93_12215 [Serratia sp. Leaf50]|nr:hypothetical protein ASE93_12215 [Serratia sp. Leaf50]